MLSLFLETTTVLEEVTLSDGLTTVGGSASLAAFGLGVEAVKIAGEDSMVIFAIGGFDPDRPWRTVTSERSLVFWDTRAATVDPAVVEVDVDTSTRDGRRESDSK